MNYPNGLKKLWFQSMSHSPSKLICRLKLKSCFTDYILNNYNIPKNPKWDYEVISVRLYVKHLLRHEHVQCSYGTTYVLYELNDNFLNYKVRRVLDEKYGETSSQVKIPKFFKELRLIFVLLVHNNLIHSKSFARNGNLGISLWKVTKNT